MKCGVILIRQMKRSVVLILLLLLLITPADLQADEKPYIRIVQEFNRCYGKPCMDLAADLTTAKFRSRKPKSVWVYDSWHLLNQMEFKRVESKIKMSKASESKAVVVLEAKISTAGGDAEQKEVYFLILEDGGWLIDELEVVDEQVDLDEKMKGL